jgi:hypothetical protein
MLQENERSTQRSDRLAGGETLFGPIRPGRQLPLFAPAFPCVDRLAGGRGSQKDIMANAGGRR